jgi:hypothetical protein
MRGSHSEGPKSDFVTGPLKNIDNLNTVLTKLGDLIEGYNKLESTDPRAKPGYDASIYIYLFMF